MATVGAKPFAAGPREHDADGIRGEDQPDHAEEKARGASSGGCRFAMTTHA